MALKHSSQVSNHPILSPTSGFAASTSYGFTENSKAGSTQFLSIFSLLWATLAFFTWVLCLTAVARVTRHPSRVPGGPAPDPLVDGQQDTFIDWATIWLQLLILLLVVPLALMGTLARHRALLLSLLVLTTGLIAGQATMRITQYTLLSENTVADDELKAFPGAHEIAPGSADSGMRGTMWLQNMGLADSWPGYHEVQVVSQAATCFLNLILAMTLAFTAGSCEGDGAEEGESSGEDECNGDEEKALLSWRKEHRGCQPLRW